MASYFLFLLSKLTNFQTNQFGSRIDKCWQKIHFEIYLRKRSGFVVGVTSDPNLFWVNWEHVFYRGCTPSSLPPSTILQIIHFLYKNQLKIWWCSMFSFFEGFQRQNVLILFLFFYERFYLLPAKITVDVYNSLLRSIKLYTPRKYSITSNDGDGVLVILL